MGEKVTIGKRIAVFGGGNAAIDCARVAKRIGAEEETILYADDTTTIIWRSQGVTLLGIDASFSSDGGRTFSSVKSGNNLTGI